VFKSNGKVVSLLEVFLSQRSAQAKSQVTVDVRSGCASECTSSLSFTRLLGMKSFWKVNLSWHKVNENLTSHQTIKQVPGARKVNYELNLQQSFTISEVAYFKS